MKNKNLIVLAFWLTLGAEAFADDGNLLTQKYMCNYCHSLEKKIIGPPWQSISILYQDRPDAEAYLIGKIRSGGSGIWSDSKMPPSSTVSEADIKAMAQYILSLPKQ